MGYAPARKCGLTYKVKILPPPPPILRMRAVKNLYPNAEEEYLWAFLQYLSDNKASNSTMANTSWQRIKYLGSFTLRFKMVSTSTFEFFRTEFYNLENL